MKVNPRSTSDALVQKSEHSFFYVKGIIFDFGSKKKCCWINKKNKSHKIKKTFLCYVIFKIVPLRREKYV